MKATMSTLPLSLHGALLVFAFFSLLPGSIFAQWGAQVSGTTNHILGIHFVDGNTGYAAGTAGTILKTTDGGVNWNAQSSGSGNNFYAVCFTGASNGVAVGDNGLIARTTDGGTTWNLLSAPVYADWRAVWFLNANVGFITGGLSGTTANILKTTDGGASWTDISPNTFPASAEVLYSIFFTDPNTGYASNYDGYILKTLDGGTSWSAQFVSNNHLFGLYFTDANHGYCVGGDQDLNTTVILKTTDAGANWTALDNPYPAANYFIDVEFVDANTGYAAGGHVQNNTGTILKTTDAGLNWTIETTTPATTSRLYRLSMPSAMTGYACGLDGTILKFPKPGSPDQPCDNTFVQSLTGMGGSRPNIFPHPNGDFFATGLRNDSTVIIRFDPGGSPLWARAFRLGSDIVQISDMFVDSLGDLFGVAYPQVFAQSDLRGVAFRYNMASHSFVWTQYIPNATSTQIHALDAENCVLTGISKSGYTHLMKIDKSTGAISGYNLEGDSGDFYSTLYKGTLYGTCRRYYDGFQASVFAHDPVSGAPLWQNTIISNNGPSSTRMYPVKPVVDSSGILVLASGDLAGFNVYLDGPVELVLAKTNLTGDVAWTRQYTIAGFDRPVGMAIVPTATGYYLVGNLYQESLGDFAFSVLIKTDKQGQLQWAKRLGISGRNIARNVMERNGYLYLTLASDSYAFNDLLLVKLDENGNTNTDCGFVQPISVDVTDLPNIQNVRNYDVFDNGVALLPLDAVPAETGLQTVTYCSTPCPCPILPVSAGPDTVICAGRQAVLQATSGFDTYLWSPAATLDNPNIQNPTAMPTTTTTYTLQATKNGAELLANGDFSQGNTGFASGYIFSGTGEGHYYVTDNPQLYNPQWNIPLDHSPSADNMMLLFDGAANGSLPTLWQQSVQVQPNTGYIFQLWGAMAGFDQAPVIEVSVNGVVQGTFALTGGNNSVGVWQPFSLNINSGAATQLIIALRDLNTAAQGNDFALDDISLRAVCSYTDSVTVTVNPPIEFTQNITQCENEPFVFNGNEYTVSGTYTYLFTAANGCDSLLTLNLVFIPLPTRAEPVAFCAGQSVVIGGNTYTQAGTVVDTIPSLTGCDTVVTYTLTVLPLPTRVENIAFCAGESVVIGGNIYTQAGTVMDTIPGLAGCDTVATYTLTVLPLATRIENIAFCPGETINIGGNGYTQPGTVVDTIAGTAGCDTVVTYNLHYLTPAPSVVTITCPPAVNIAVAPGAGPTIANYTQPAATSDCPCPGISLSLTAGLPSGSAFPPGKTPVCYTAQDSCGNSASCCFEVIIREALACDIKETGCMKYELLTITADAIKNLTYRIRVTNKCADKLIYTAVQLPDGITALTPAHLSVYAGESGREYEVRNPNYSPFYSIRFKSTTDSISGGQSEIFQYTLPAQMAPDYIHITARLAPQAFYEAHLNTFNCPIEVKPVGNKAADRASNAPIDRPAPRLFPNPNAGELFIDLAGWSGEKVELRVFDAQGRELRRISTVAGESPYALHLPDGLAAGLYTVHLLAENGERQALRFVLQR